MTARRRPTVRGPAVTQPLDRPPIPDPTVLTTEQLLRATQAERDYVDGQLDVIRERLRGIDVATVLLNETVNRVPTETQTAVGRLQDLVDEKFRSVSLQFGERDTRSERESKDNKVAVDAAFAAQKEAAAKQDDANQKSIDKSEKGTLESINKLQDLIGSNISGINDKIAALAERMTRSELLLTTQLTQLSTARTTEKQTYAGLYVVAGLVIAAIGIAVSILVATRT